MESIRSLIKERIKSCISCNENECAVIKNRLEHHVLSHHSRSVNGHVKLHQKSSKVQMSSESAMSDIKLEEQTSTSDLSLNSFTKAKNNTEYKKNLKEALFKWYKDSQIVKDEHETQNILNELLEKLCEKHSEIGHKFYELTLSNELDKFLNSISNVIGCERNMYNLKEDILNKIHEVNKKFMKDKPNNIEDLNNVSVNKYKTKETGVNTDLKFKGDDGLGENYSDSITQFSSITSDEPFVRNNIMNAKKKFVDTQIQNSSLTNTIPLYKSIYGERQIQSGYFEKDDIIKQKILEWILDLKNKDIIHFGNCDISTVVDNFYKQLKTVLSTKSSSAHDKIVLRKKILNFVNKYIDKYISDENLIHLNKLANTLATILLKENNRMIQNEYLQNENDNFELSDEKKINVHRAVYDIVANTLVNHGIYSDRLNNNIAACIFEHMECTNDYRDQHLKSKLLKTLRSSTGLSDIYVVRIIDDITNDIDALNDNLNFEENINELQYNNIFSVYKSQTELIGQFNRSNVNSNRRRSSISKKPIDKTAEKTYINDVTATIKSWFDILPSNLRKSKRKKDAFVNGLATDILDQVKLKELVEVINEKEKYIAFFIYRWLNKFQYFENIDEAKPYVDELVKKLKDIPEPGKDSCAQFTLKKIHNDKSNNFDKKIEEEMKVLRDEITKILYSLSSNVLIIKDKNKKDKFIKDLVLQIQNMITEKQTLGQISEAIHERLKEIIKSKDTIIKLKENLTNNIKNVIEKLSLNDDSIDINNLETLVATEDIFKSFIAKYLEHSYDSEYSIARDAFSLLLKNELNSISTPQANNADRDHEKDEAIIDKLSKELQYINIISDWLKTLPLEDSFYKIDRRALALLVTKLAKNISDLEESSKFINEITIKTVINQFLEQMPISQYYRKNINSMIADLCSKLERSLKDRQYNELENSNGGAMKETFNNLNLTDFIEKYIRSNSSELYEDEIKLEACVLRLFELIGDNVRNLTDLSIPHFHSQDNNTDLKGDERARKFSNELGYANEICEWLKNLPLKPIDDIESQNKIIEMITTLAETISEMPINEKYSYQENHELIDYIKEWICALPLDSSREVLEPIAAEQLLNRLERVNVEKRKLNKNKEEFEKGNIPTETCTYTETCGNNLNDLEHNDIGTVIINEVESWCSRLPIESGNEITNKILRQNVATKLYQKIGELNMIPEYFTNDFLYQELLGEEVEKLLDNLPQNTKLKAGKNDLKKQFLKAIIKKRNEIRDKTSAIQYKYELEKTIDTSMPNPVRIHQEESPGFKIYKDRLVAIFILENFDYSNDYTKLNYVNKLKIEINKHFKDAQMRNSIPLTKEQMYNELYSAFFSVPLPHESSIIEEVEDIKTRCEINDWFHSLPLREARSVREILEWDQIIAMLSKRLRQMEKYAQNPNSKMYKEIYKWLIRLPLLPDETQIDIFTRDLLMKLKSSQQARKCVTRDIITSIPPEIKEKTENNEVLESTQVAETSNDNSTWYTPPSYSSPACCRSPARQEIKQPADIIINIVEDWCRQLPLLAANTTEKQNISTIKESIAIKIIMKISELNMKSEIFGDDYLYESLLDDELENQLSILPKSYEFEKIKTAHKHQLINAIKSVKPLIEEEKARYEYKRHLKNIIDNVLKIPNNKNDEMSIALASLSDEIADSFIAYNFYKHNAEMSQMREKLDDNVKKLFSLIKHSNLNIKMPFDPLMTRNQLICEFSKISAPSKSATVKELKEIEMKFIIEKLFEKLNFPQSIGKVAVKNKIKASLAKRLTDFENIGYTTENCEKMKVEIIKRLKKIDDNIDIERIDSFIEILKNTQLNRSSIYQKSAGNSSKSSTDVFQKQSLINLNENDSAAKEKWIGPLPATLHQNKNNDDQDERNALSRLSSSYKNLENELLTPSPIGENNPKALYLKHSQNEFDNNQTSRPDLTIPAYTSPNDNYTSQSQTLSPEILKLPGSNISQEFGMQNEQKNGVSLLQRAHAVQPSSNQEYMLNQDSKRQMETSPLLHKISTSKMSPSVPARHIGNSFEQFPVESQTSGRDSYSEFTNKRDSATQDNGAIFNSKIDISVSNENFELPYSCVTHPNPSTVRIPQKTVPSPIIHRTCRRPSITIFSPSYLEPEVRGSHQDIRDQLKKSRNEFSEEETQCSCQKLFLQRRQKLHCTVPTRKYCKFCNRVHPIKCGMYRYPGCFYD